ncbi:E3 ubiquitin protein ligase DRIP1-like [Gossypium australe]|uniref:E3 ubiquitin protein ligase DRIP1-like n=1 Tax=Gossypium australe TaxID=47621 RepID=A0A5B6UP84_9ROSI|nr:E3 ubiquitin protein ligase DRIP1-like [Gossypium australe]
MSNDYINVQRRPLMEFLTCPLCSNIYREATTICVCLHTFCKQCIYEKVEKEKTRYCPMCDAYLGSIPQHMLRNDHKLEKLVMQIFPLEKPNEDNTENRFSNHSMNPIMKQNELDNSEPTVREFSLERSRKGLCWEHLGGHKDGETYGTEVQVKRRRRTQRKPYCKFLIGQREEGLKIATTNEISKTDTSGLEKSTDSLNRCGDIVYLNQDSGCFPRPVWFCLLASQETNDMALPQIPKPFISTKNGDLAISIVNKYLAMKLNLKHESEVHEAVHFAVKFKWDGAYDILPIDKLSCL